MVIFQEIIQKFNELGGIESIPEEAFPKKACQETVQTIQTRYACILPENYVRLQEVYGAFRWKHEAVAAFLKQTSYYTTAYVGSELYSLSSAYKMLCSDAFQTSDDDIADLLPLCEGNFADFIGMSLRAESFGKIYYYDHEAMYEGEELVLLAYTFDEFVLKLKIYEEPEPEPEDPSAPRSVIRLTREMLELLRKTGNEPSEYELLD